MKKELSGFLVSLLYLILGIVFLIYRSSIFTTAKFVIGIILLVIGLIRIFGAAIKRKNSSSFNTVGDFTVGILIAIVGILLILPVLDNLLGIAFGLFFIFDGAGKLINAFGSANSKNTGWWISLIIALLIVGAGIFIILKWSAIVDYIAVVVGIILIVSGVQGFIALLTGKKKY